MRELVLADGDWREADDAGRPTEPDDHEPEEAHGDEVLDGGGCGLVGDERLPVRNYGVEHHHFTSL